MYINPKSSLGTHFTALCRCYNWYINCTIKDLLVRNIWLCAKYKL